MGKAVSEMTSARRAPHPQTPCQLWVPARVLGPLQHQQGEERALVLAEETHGTWNMQGNTHLTA